jgi:multisubunit Na+/H+ antiporter MnhF subunit
MILIPLWVCFTARPIDGVVGLALAGTMTTLALLCLAEGFHRGVYFNVALVCAGATFVGGLVFARFFGREL